MKRFLSTVLAFLLTVSCLSLPAWAETDEFYFDEQPFSSGGMGGDPVSFYAHAVGAVRYQWQCSEDWGYIWRDITGETSCEYSFVFDGNNDRQYRCAAYDAEEHIIYSDVVNIRMPALIGIWIEEDPISQVVLDGEEVTFSVLVMTEDAALFYSTQWYYCSYEGDDWSPIDDATLDDYTFTASLDQNGWRFKAIVLDEFGIEYESNEATLTVNPRPARTIESNGHTYAYYNTYLPWQDAKTFCEENGGYLMTVTTAGEQDILAQLNEDDEGIFLGGYRVDEDSWAWVTGEEFIYSNWNDGEPNNGLGGDPETYVGSFEGAGSRWNDFPENPTDVAGFIMETGEVEPIPIRSAEYNGHSYYYFNTYLPWQEAKAFCEEHGGYLMTVTSSEEQGILEELNENDEGIYLGGYLENDEWRWVSGEAFIYSNWNEGEPNNGNGTEPEMYVGAFAGTGSGWNDFPENPTDVTGFIVEVGEKFDDVNIIPITGIKTLELTVSDRIPRLPIADVT